MNKVFAVLTVMLFALPLFGQGNSRLYGPALAVGEGTSNTLVLQNTLAQEKLLTVVFYSAKFGREYPLSVNGGAPIHVFRVALEPHLTATYQISGGEFDEQVWLQVSGGHTSIDPGELIGVKGVLTRNVGGEAFTSELTRPGTKFEFQVSETDRLTSGLAITVVGYSPWDAPSKILVEILEGEEVVAQKRFLWPAAHSQDARVLWQFFASSAEDWERMVRVCHYMRPLMKGTIRVTADGNPIAATVVAVEK